MQFLIPLLVVFSSQVQAAEFNHNALIPQSKIQYKDIYGVYHGETLNLGGNFRWQIRIKKIEGRSGLIYYRSSNGDKCVGRYSTIFAIPQDDFQERTEVVIRAENADCMMGGTRRSYQIGLWIPGDRPMDGKRGPRKYKGGLIEGMAQIPSAVYKAVVSHP